MQNSACALPCRARPLGRSPLAGAFVDGEAGAVAGRAASAAADPGNKNSLARSLKFYQNTRALLQSLQKAETTRTDRYKCGIFRG